MKKSTVVVDRLVRAQEAAKSGALSSYASKLGAGKAPASPTTSWGPMMRV
ncbi:MAG: hypothetical protein KIS79_15950 [Burkholderiales bacterium]|nr:hypothetical protein [Burkholderiales bacterium]